ncbi:MAG TPA: c-type cytochrome [Vicinamibacterales bacterium]|nr:c-type cytochrome [Vicinamibacterales bacterium]
MVGRAGRVRLAVAIGLLALVPLAGVAVQAQEREQPRDNPLQGNATAIKQGQNIYRGRCGVCHGIDAKGYRGSDLTTGDWVHGGTDPQIFKTIRTGVPGTEMPGNPNMSEEEIWMVISYLRTLSAPGGAPVERGDAGRGEQIFWAKDRGNCGQCHMIGARGGRIGPNLSRIGAARSAAALEREIRRPAEVIPVGFETVTVVTKDGRRIRGARKNEDTFSVQIMTANEEIQSFSKKDVEVVPELERSLMPTYGPERLNAGDLDDLVRYLRSLRGERGVQ